MDTKVNATPLHLPPINPMMGFSDSIIQIMNHETSLSLGEAYVKEVRQNLNTLITDYNKRWLVFLEEGLFSKDLGLCTGCFGLFSKNEISAIVVMGNTRSWCRINHNEGMDSGKFSEKHYLCESCLKKAKKKCEVVAFDKVNGQEFDLFPDLPSVGIREIEDIAVAYGFPLRCELTEENKVVPMRELADE
jgi:hypothetical protein